MRLPIAFWSLILLLVCAGSLEVHRAAAQAPYPTIQFTEVRAVPTGGGTADVVLAWSFSFGDPNSTAFDMPFTVTRAPVPLDGSPPPYESYEVIAVVPHSTPYGFTDVGVFPSTTGFCYRVSHPFLATWPSCLPAVPAPFRAADDLPAPTWADAESSGLGATVWVQFAIAWSGIDAPVDVYEVSQERADGSYGPFRTILAGEYGYDETQMPQRWSVDVSPAPLSPRCFKVRALVDGVAGRPTPPLCFDLGAAPGETVEPPSDLRFVHLSFGTRLDWTTNLGAYATAPYRPMFQIDSGLQGANGAVEWVHIDTVDNIEGGTAHVFVYADPGTTRCYRVRTGLGGTISDYSDTVCLEGEAPTPQPTGVPTSPSSTPLAPTGASATPRPPATGTGPSVDGGALSPWIAIALALTAIAIAVGAIRVRRP